jgi:hypothetical protein
VLFWSGVVGFGCWFLVELLEAASQWSRDSQARRRLGADARPGESAYEERLRLRAAEVEEGDSRGARP